MSQKRTFQEFSPLTELTEETPRRNPRKQANPKRRVLQARTHRKKSTEPQEVPRPDEDADSESIGSQDSERSSDSFSDSAESLRCFLVSDDDSSDEIEECSSEDVEEDHGNPLQQDPEESDSDDERTRSNFVPVSFIDYCSAFFSVDEPSSTVPDEMAQGYLDELSRAWRENNTSLTTPYYYCVAAVMCGCSDQTLDVAYKGCPTLMNKYLQDITDVRCVGRDGDVRWYPLTMDLGAHRHLEYGSACPHCKYYRANLAAEI